MLRGLRERETGLLRAEEFRSVLEASRWSNLSLSRRRRIDSNHALAVSSLEIDPSSHTYLLSASRSTVSVHNVKKAHSYSDACCRDAALEASTACSNVNIACWYPRDVGIFLTSSQSTVSLWSTERLEPEVQLQPECHNVFAMAMPPERDLVAVGGSFPTAGTHLPILDLASGACAFRLRGHTDTIRALAWSPRDANLLLSGSDDRSLRLWDIRRSGESACLLTFNQYKAGIALAELNGAPGTNLGLSALWDASGAGSVASTHARKRRRQGVPSTEVRAHSAAVDKVMFTADSSYAVSAGLEGRVRLWDVFTGRNLVPAYQSTGPRGGTARVRALARDPAGLTLLIATRHGIQIFDVISAVELGSFAVPRHHGLGIGAMCTNPSLDEVYYSNLHGDVVVCSVGVPGSEAGSPRQASASSSGAINHDDDWT